MLEILKKKYPNQFDIPTKTEIRQQITALIAKYKKHRMTVLPKRGMQEPHKRIIEAIVEESWFQILLKEALICFKEKVNEHHSDRDDIPEDSKVKSFVSAVKSKHKRKKCPVSETENKTLVHLYLARFSV